VEGRPAAAVAEALAAARVTVTVSPAESSLIDMTRRGLDAVVRASPHYFVSSEQIDRAVTAVRAVTVA
jgi:selenocysteine lyase/cysteine desulfurase